MKSSGASAGFAPLARPDARVLILGSLPGDRSIAAQEYYAHPRNAFWRIMETIFGIHGSYSQRCEELMQHRLALWDVLAESVRPGSLDAKIRVDTAVVNDFNWFLNSHERIGRIGFNGRKAADLFRRFVAPGLPPDKYLTKVLPSTSPAYAGMRFDEKCTIWREFLADT
jgi:hypoxanthine-DNA glycosylase